jgi:putative colanic acid biosynthesis acetyltransferase WcaF
MKKTPMTGGPTFPVKHRLRRAAWNLVWGVFGKWSPTPLHGWRRFLVRSFGGTIDATAKIYPGVAIWLPSNLVMEAHACLGPGSICYNMDKIHLSRFALVSQRAHLCAGTHDIYDAAFPLRTKPISLGEGSWVAAEAFVGPGVTVGKRAVLGARGVAFRELRQGGVYAGNPAALVRWRDVTQND